MTDPKSILCLDLDGTLIDSQEQLHPKDRQILAQFPEDIQPIFTTGRPLHSTKVVLQRNQLFNGSPLPLPGVFLNGGVAYLPQEALCTQHTFPLDTRDHLIDLCRSFWHSTFAFFSLFNIYLVNAMPFSRQVAHHYRFNALEKHFYEVPDEILKVMIIENDPQVLETIQNNLDGLRAEMGYSLPHLFEINPEGINKANTLKKLLTRMKLAQLPVAVVGDAENDLSLFKIAHTSFAPATAYPSILDRADHIIDREKDGLLEPILAQIHP
jgi:Cof subfamily protein (haloacid dehalogenase superfamily)